MTKKSQDLTITTRVNDLASKELRGLGKTGKLSAASIATGFIAAKAAIAGFSLIVKSTVNVVKSLTIDVAEQGDVFAKTSKKLGVAVETLSAFKHIAELSGTSFDAVGKGFKALAKNAVDFKDGVGEAKDAFAELGITVTDPSGGMRDLETIFIDTADALGKMDDSTKRAAHAQRIFGRAGLDLIPIFLEGKDGIIAMREESERLGLVWTEEGALAAEKFNDAMLRMKRSFDGVKMAIANELLPEFTKFFEETTANVIANKDEIVEWAKAFTDQAVPALKAFAEGVGDIGRAVRVISDDLAGFMRLVNGDASWQARTTGAKVGGKGLGVRGVVVPQVASTKPGETSGSATDLGGKLKPLPKYVHTPQYSSPIGPEERLPLQFDMLNEKAKETTYVMGAFNTQAAEVDTTLQDLGTSGVSTVGSAFNSFFDSMQRGTMDTASAVRSMASDILSSLQRLAVNQLFMQIAGAVLGGAAGGTSGMDVMTGGTPWVPAGGVPSRAIGGPVPGSPGSPQLIMAHGGEHVLSQADLRSRGGGGVTINQTINPSQGMDEKALGEFAAAAVSRQMRESRGFKRQLRGVSRGGLY